MQCHDLEPLLVQQLNWSFCFKMENVPMNQFKKRNHADVLLNLKFLSAREDLYAY